MKYSFWGTFELKSSQIWHKNVFKFFKFSGTNLGWGGQALVQKRGQVSDGGDWQNFCRMGDPPVPPPQEKKPWFMSLYVSNIWMDVNPDLGTLQFHFF